jgi:ABC-type uncharacterized transport system permease subunit
MIYYVGTPFKTLIVGLTWGILYFIFPQFAHQFFEVLGVILTLMLSWGRFGLGISTKC